MRQLTLSVSAAHSHLVVAAREENSAIGSQIRDHCLHVIEIDDRCRLLE